MTEEIPRNLERRLIVLEEWKNSQATDKAVREERDRHMDKRFDRVEKAVEEVKGYLLKIVWLIITGIVVAFLTFALSGGLNAPL